MGFQIIYPTSDSYSQCTKRKKKKNVQRAPATQQQKQTTQLKMSKTSK